MKKTILPIIALMGICLYGNAQNFTFPDIPRELPRDLLLDSTVVRSYEMVTEYQDYDLKGNFQRKTRITAGYTSGLENGTTVRWNNVFMAQTYEEYADFSTGTKQELMEGFSYDPAGNIESATFFDDIQGADIMHKNLVWDMVALEGFAYWFWDDLRMNTEYKAGNLNAAVDLAGEGTFTNKDIRIQWIGITVINGEICAIIKYYTMNNLLSVKTGDISVTGRSHYWGEVYVSLQDKEIEFATLFEDVITEVIMPGQPDFSGYTVRYITLNRKS